MKEICEARHVPNDIAVDAESRIYGDDWFKFLSSSRAMLGSESACNVFDFDGDVERQIDAFRAAHHRDPSYQDLADVLSPIEQYFDVGQISPRAFECALMHTPMVLFRGRYSDAIEPDNHYIPLERDFSNADEVLANLADLDLLQGVADRAHERLVRSGRFGYRSLAKQLVETIEEEYPRRIDPAWLDFRHATAAPWHPVEQIEVPRTEEEVRQKLLIQRPTDMPLLHTEFTAMQDELLSGYRALEMRNASVQSCTHSKERPAGYATARRLWYLLPEDVRYGIAGYFRSVIS